MRKLSLAREVLAELSTDELSGVVGGTVKTQLCPTDPCITTPVSQLRCTLSLAPAVCA
jgi:hypothetical protein